MGFTGMENIGEKVIDRSPDQLISSFSGEFADNELEQAFLTATWKDYKKSTRNALFTGGLIFMAFSMADLLSGLNIEQLQFAFLTRVFAGLFLLGSAIYIQREKSYFTGFNLLLLINQIVIAIAVIFVGVIRDLIFIHNAFHVFIITLLYYQFMHNRFSFTLGACGFFPVAYLIVSLGQYHFELIDIVRFVLYLVLANGLGIPLLSSSNKNRRKEWVQYMKEQHLNRKLKSTVETLRHAQQEIKTLKGIIPICSNCKKIKDDKGYWKQIEEYVREHSDAEFSHGLCQECAKKLYPDINPYDN